MLHLKCDECGVLFDTGQYRLYCDRCASAKRQPRQQASGGFRMLARVYPPEKPATTTEPITGHTVCGCCGSTDLTPTSGQSCFGVGSFTRCVCGACLDFRCDSNE